MSRTYLADNDYHEQMPYDSSEEIENKIADRCAKRHKVGCTRDEEGTMYFFDIEENENSGYQQGD